MLPSVVACVVLGASLAARPAHADGPPQATAANAAAARRHFDKARTFYEQGQYHEAIGELDTAHALDPSAKDLVFNLGVVHEKLGDIDDALRWFRLYAGMSLTPQESDRAEAYVRRLEGARREVEGPHKGPAAAPPATPNSNSTPTGTATPTSTGSPTPTSTPPTLESSAPEPSDAPSPP
ncbi:MAG: tetratricopeptide repeat protein, partial [Polyangiaceae bacterium]